MQANARLKLTYQVSVQNFFHFYHSRYLRPVKDHLVANLEVAAPYMAKQPTLFNYFTKLKITQSLVEKNTRHD